MLDKIKDPNTLSDEAIIKKLPPFYIFSGYIVPKEMYHSLNNTISAEFIRGYYSQKRSKQDAKLD